MKNILLLLLLFTGIVNGQIVNIPDANFKAKLLAADVTNNIASNNSTDLLSAPSNAKIDLNNDGEIQASEAALITSIYVQSANISSLQGIESFTNLMWLFAGSNQLTSLNVNNLTNLVTLDCGFNQISNLDVSNLSNLRYLACPHNNLTLLNFNGSQLRGLGCNNNYFLNTLDLSSCNYLRNLDCSSLGLTSLNLPNNNQLSELVCGSNPISVLDLSNLDKLTILRVGGTNITSLDVSNSPNLNILNIYNPQLLTLNIKNGKSEGDITIANSPNLSFICADESQIAYLQSLVGGSAVVSSYCSFVPGGDYNTISGVVKWDQENDGCDSSDSNFPYNTLMNLSNGENSSGTFLKADGNYILYAETGSYTLTPQIEESSYFTITPTFSTINFPLLDNSISTQNFCLTPNGFHPDLEVVITPVGAARPGFDSYYKIVYKNKGNQLLNGIVNLIFDDVRTDFVSALPAVDNQQAGSLTWNFSNLYPFETRAIDLVFNLNSPLENPPLNSGDLLHFIANTSSSIGEGTLLDNTFELNQTVVNSYDPNDKTCLEGNTITPEDIGKYVHYNINFENVGTADAVNVVIKDIIDTTMFDMNSLQLLYASHPVETKIDGNKVEFIFKNINLPPSIIDPIGGHGNVLFKIKTLPTLLVGNQIANIANIYFDYNAPIETNEARSTFAALSNANFVKDASITIAPNPAKNNVTVTSKNNIKSIQLFDVQGRILQTVLENSKTTTLDISNKTNGIYFLKITTEVGSIVEKIIKE